MTRTTAPEAAPSRVGGDGSRRGADPRQPDPRAAIKPDDGFVAAFFTAPIANLLLLPLAATRVTPNQVTAAGIATKLAATALYASGRWPALVAGAVLVQLLFVLDCLDGQLARHRGEASRFGEWIDFMADCFGDIVLLCGIGIGCAARGGGAAPFLWSYAAILVLCYRYFDGMMLLRVLGAEYEELSHAATSAIDAPDKVAAIEGARARRSAEWGAFARLLDALAPKGTRERSAVLFWAKRVLLFGSGERYLAISILGVADRPEWIFPLFVAWGGIVYPLITVRRWQLFGGRSGA